MAEWARFDEQLCRLVDRLRATGYGFTLEAELRLMGVENYCYEEHDFPLFLPEFSEKGIVTIIDADHGGQILYSSTRIR